jgi:hypothetical protein
VRDKTALGTVRKYHPGVTKVVDSKKDIDIEVTAADCKGSKRKSPGNCAMARAFKREYDGAIISLSTAYLIKGDKAIRYAVPQSVQREIVSFDRAHDFSPGEYSLKKVQPGNRLGARRGGSDAGRDPTRKTKLPNKVHRTAGIRSL